MTKDEAHKALLAGDWLSCYSDHRGTQMWYNNTASMCSNELEFQQDGGEYSCCHNDYENVEELLEALERDCEGNWEEVS